MDSATEDIYLQKLQEFIYDEEKAVTFRWLSLALDISVNEAKHILGKYVSDAKDTTCIDIMATYLVSGIAADGSLHILICPENELDKKKAIFQKIVDEQIYSVQKCKELDLNILSMVDYFDTHNPKGNLVCGSLTSKKCTHRILKTKKLLHVAPKSVVQPSIFSKILPKSGKHDLVKEHSTKTKINNGITGFFNKATTQVSVKSKPETTEIRSEEPKPISDKTPTANGVNKLIDSDSDSEQPIPKSQSKLENSEKKKRNHSTKRSKKSNNKSPSPKRRKRIIEQESDSDDMFGSDTKEEINEVVDDDNLEPEEASKPKVNIPLAPKNKKRKLVDRTYENDEGYIVTTKEWIEENPSEDEIIPEASQKDLKELKTEVNASTKDKKFTKSESNEFSDTPKDGKMMNGKVKGAVKRGKKALATNQPTLMNFFKRA